MSFVPALQKLLGNRRVRIDSSMLDECGSDAWLVSHRPEAVVFADNVQCVSRVMRFAQRHQVPVTARGAGVGYVGGCVPMRGGIVLSLARMKRIRVLNA